MRTKTKLEYIWLDSNGNIRSKIKVVDKTKDLTINNVPIWNFDGSSTKQAVGTDSDCILSPVRLYNNHVRRDHYLVLCEVMDSDNTPNHYNYRAVLRQYSKVLSENDWWFAFEQEYFMYKDGKPLGWNSTMKPQGEYYCGVGSNNVSGRQLVNSHLDKCLDSDIGITGTNAEVALGQWEYQIMGTNTLKACDDLIVARYLLAKEGEKWDIVIELHPKPIKGSWNGSGCHVNFSTKQMRENGSLKLMEELCDTLSFYHDDHIEVYGKYNELRLTGEYETQAIDKFTWGISDRGASIRIPLNVVNNDYKGYLEDRRPASNIDPYIVTAKIVDTLWSNFQIPINVEM